MTASYLTRPKIPVALSRMIGSIEAGSADDKLDAMQKKRLRWRARLIRRQLALRPMPAPSRERLS
jgi:hypothetical protein